MDQVAEVVLGVPRGFCAGVVRAIDIVNLCLDKFGPPIYVKHQIVHNPYVVEELEKKGAITVESVDEIPEGSIVVFSAHGSPPEDFENAKSLHLKIIDAVCPLVTRVHNEAKKYHNEGKRVLLVGHEGHQEVKGTMGQAPMTLISDGLDRLIPQWDRSTDVAIITQTTLSVQDTSAAITEIQNSFNNATIRNDICYATTNRQDAVLSMSGKVDIVLVIGAQNSSNCNRLREVAESLGIAAYLINGPAEIESKWIKPSYRIGITSGASTPEILVDEVIKRLNPSKITVLPGVDENISFRLPKELR
ncbi:MAG: 4-hydroxy-3-methylbut-2-enyl diphosphate reductase [Dehalococcoidia bacterium]|nr:4-hydroxy-3-methylbut-2-enyl diphosphate reductase [Dehalococcoidia bacterium]|tara:strand:+ start:13376 stop:14287 length:912 start_codon:yes stop_codon:yes gene_type:complete